MAGKHQVLAMVAALVLAGTAAARRFRRRPDGPMGPGHTAEGESVALTRYDGERVGLRIQNDEWAKRVQGREVVPTG